MNSASSFAVSTTKIKTAIYLKTNTVSDTLQIETAEDIKTSINTTTNINTAAHLKITTIESVIIQIEIARHLKTTTDINTTNLAED